MSSKLSTGMVCCHGCREELYEWDMGKHELCYVRFLEKVGVTVVFAETPETLAQSRSQRTKRNIALARMDRPPPQVSLNRRLRRSRSKAHRLGPRQ